MITPHCHGTISLIKQRLSQLALHMTGRISTTLQEPATHEGMDRLRLGLDPSRTDVIRAWRIKMPLESILRHQAPEDVARTYKEDRLY